MLTSSFIHLYFDNVDIEYDKDNTSLFNHMVYLDTSTNHIKRIDWGKAHIFYYIILLDIYPVQKETQTRWCYKYYMIIEQYYQQSLMEVTEQIPQSSVIQRKLTDKKTDGFFIRSLWA